MLFRSNMVNEQNHQISMKLSAKMDRTADAVQRLQDEMCIRDRAMELGEIEGAMSSLAIAVAGLLTVVGASVFAQFM